MEGVSKQNHFSLIRTLTVGWGIAPHRPEKQVRRLEHSPITAGGDFHPAPKLNCIYIIAHFCHSVNF